MNLSFFTALGLLATSGGLDGGAAESPAAGHWLGAMERGGALLPIAVDITETEGELACTLDLPTWGMIEMRTRVKVEGARVAIGFGGDDIDLELDAASGSLRGRLTDDGAVIAVELTRTLAPWTPPIALEEVEFESADGVKIAGVMALPAEGERLPGLVLVQGRSYGSRRQFRSHALLAARRGIAAIVFDGRGTGLSGGVRGAHTLRHRIDDAEAALSRLRAHPRVDGARVGMFGHSAGGWVAPVVAQRTGDLAFCILHSGPSVSLAEQQGQVVRELARLSDTEFSAEELDATYEYQRALTRMAIDGAEWPAIEAHVARARGERWSSFVDLPESNENPELDYYRRNPHDSTAALRELDVPLLALFGQRDFVVPPEFNVPELERLMGEAGNENHRIVVFEEANHDIFVDEVDEDGRPYRWMRRPPGYFETVFDWIAQQVR